MCFVLSYVRYASACCYVTEPGAVATALNERMPHWLIQLCNQRLSSTGRAREFIGVIHLLECGRYRSRFCKATTS
jgi:hypothetical protein